MNIKLQSKLKWGKNKGGIGAMLMISFIIFSPIVASASSNTGVVDIATLLQQKIVTLTIKEKPIRFVLNEIKKQIGIGFIIKDSKTESDLAEMSISVSNLSVEKTLETLLKNTGYKYSIENNVIMIVKVTEVKKQPTVQSPKNAIAGTILNDLDRKPIAGATIILEGTSSGAISDMNGKFLLNASENDILSISYVGKVEQKFVVKDDKPIIIILKSDAMAMDDVVVTGYGDVKRSSYTGSAVTVGREQLLKVSKTNVIKALQSFDPSFRIKENNQWGSDPNALPEVYIRGESGIGVKAMDKDELSKSNLKDNPNLPTFIMDGFEISVQKLYDYDPNRIESITILKDAAATALYGSRAANGVVVITTVAPKEGKVNVSYNFTGDITFPDLSDYNLTNAAEKLEVERLAGSFTHDPTIVGSQYELTRMYNQKLANVRRGVDTYWLSQPLKTVFNHKHSLYIDGGSENLRFGFDANYTNQDGVMKESFRDRINAGFYINYQYKNFSVRNYVTYSQAKAQESPYGNFSNYADALPYNEFKDENGNYLESLYDYGDRNTYINPLYESGLNNFDKDITEEFINNLSINWNITKDLLFKAQLSLTKEIGKSERFLDPLSKQNKLILGPENLSSGELTNDINDGFIIDATVTLSYNKNFGKNNVNLLAGMNIKENNSSNSSEYFEGFPSGVLNSPNYAQKSPTKPKYEESTNRLAGFMASLNYSFDNIYLLDASVRLDGSSSFGSEKRFAPFWSFGAGLNIHNYKFFRDFKAVNHLKIRGSYGQTGKANFPAYTARTTYVTLTDEWYKTGYGVTLQGYGNKNLTWETTNTLDVGGEIGLFDNLVFIKGAYYHKKTIDLINDVTIPSSTGFNTYKDNIGEILNEGYEFDLRFSVLRTKNSNLIINANIAHNKNTILKISESLKAYNDAVIKKFKDANQFTDKDVNSPFVQYTEGGSLNSIWGNKSLGINPATGEEVYVTPKGDMINSWVASNQQVLGNSDPKGQGSIGVNYSYKRFSFYANLMYEFGGQRYNSTLVEKVENVNVSKNNVDKRVLTDRWNKPGDIAKYKSLVAGRKGIVQTRPTSRFVQDYSMLSLSSINVSYDLHESILKYASLSMLRVEVGTNDLFHISTVKQERGLSYPFARTINFSIKATF